MIEYLMNQGVDINKECKRKFDGSNEKITVYEKPLYYALKRVKKKAIKFILKQGVEYEENTVIKLAINYYHREIMKFLMKHGIDFNQLIDGISTLMYALDEYK